MKRPSVHHAWSLLAASVLATGVQAQPADSLETLAIRSMNICLSGAGGGDVPHLAAAQGYEREDNTWLRLFGDRWLIFIAFPEPQGYGCRMTALRPKPDPNDSLRYSQPGPVFTDVDRVMERLTNGPLAFGLPFSVTYLREKHPSRPGHLRTKLARLTGNTLEVIYLEESHFTFEMVYAKGPRGGTGSPAMLDEVTDPEGIAGLQQAVTDRARSDYCATRPIACQERWVRVRDTSGSSSGSTSSGYDQDKHVEKLRNEGWWRNYHTYGRGKYD